MPPKIAGQAPTLHCQPTPCIGAACAAYYDLGPGLGGVCYAGSNLGFVIDGPGRARPNNGLAPGGVQ